MIKNLLIILFLFSISIPQKQSWATTRFEKFWLTKINKMKFRDPFTFTPFNIKVGYFTYGGDKYWKQFNNIISGGENSTQFEHPISFVSTPSRFDNIAKEKNRKMIITELSLLKYNFFHQKQNIIDVQFGLGYKLMKSINRVADTWSDNGEGVYAFFKPEIHEYNLNITFALQLKSSRYYSFYYSLGYASADLYRSNFGNANGTGLNQCFAFGINFIRPRQMHLSDSHHGIEIRFDKINIDSIDDPLNIIKSFKTEHIGLMYSFAIGYGGKKSLGDDAYNDMIEEEYIMAKDKFENYVYENPIESQTKTIKKMIEFCEAQAPYQMYENAEKNFREGYLEQSLWWLNQALTLADKYLIEKIQYKKNIIISEILDDYLNDKSIIEQINLLENLHLYDSSNIDLKNKLSSLLIKKGDYYLNKNNFFDAYIVYKEAINFNPNSIHAVKLKFKVFTTKIINSAYIYLQNNDNVIAYELLSLISEFSDKKNISEALSVLVDEQLDNKELISTRSRIQNILYGEEIEYFGLSGLHLGNNYLEIVNLIGHPLDKVKKKKFNNSYELATFLIHNERFRLFFKNNILIDLERAK